MDGGFERISDGEQVEVVELGVYCTVLRYMHRVQESCKIRMSFYDYKIQGASRYGVL